MTAVEVQFVRVWGGLASHTPDRTLQTHEVTHGMFHTQIVRGENLTTDQACKNAVAYAQERGWNVCPYNEGSAVYVRARFVPATEAVT